MQLLADLGFDPVLAPGMDSRLEYLAGTDSNRLDGLMALWRDESVSAIMCARGGYGCMRLLDRIPYETIEHHPKTLIGFSDVTALLHALHQRTGLITFHGPMVTSLAGLDEPSIQAFVRMTTSPRMPDLLWPEVEVLKGGDSEGALTGGNLTMLCHLMGTPYEPEFDSAVLFIEDTGEVMYRIDRALTHLRLSGKFDRLRGLLIGHFGESAQEEHVWERVLELWGGDGFPIWGRAPIGHGSSNHILPIGLPAVLNSARCSITFPYD
ncbi:MAG: LD-carboxypeptidase [Deltaproteobacteria bacterium]|nr:LD-carboxypeptidase [Deltaproteobacteria bacterium]